MGIDGMRVLMISPTPTHPQDAGNRARIFQLAEQMRSLGCDLHFVYYETEDADLEKMKRYWGDRLFVFPGNATATNAWGTNRSLLIRMSELLRRFGWPGQGARREGPAIDAWCDQDLEKAVRRLHAKKHFQTVWVEYVFLSKLLDCFDSSVRKIVDTHDVFSHRHENMAAHGIKPEWFSTTPEMEKRGLDRAEWVIAIHEEDAEVFRCLGLQQVAAIGHLVRIHAVKRIPTQKRILFIASRNPMNLKAWGYFEREILGRIKERVPSCSVQVAGKICGRIPESRYYERLGVVQDLDDLYASTTVAVNPVVWGTGLKIKTIEALAYGCPVVTTRPGIRGIESSENQGVLIGSTSKEFAECTERLLTLPQLREEQSQRGQEYVKSYLQLNLQRLKSVLGDRGISPQEKWGT